MPSVESIRQTRTPAAGTTPPTTAPNSVFAAGQAAKPKRNYGPRNPVNPDAVEIKTGVPIPPRQQNLKGQSAYAALFAKMPVGGMVEISKSQGNAFIKWAEVNKHKGELVRRPLGDDTVGIWRVAPSTEQAKP